MSLLSVVGVTRPFAVFLLPLVMILVVRRLRPWRRREVAVFLAGAAFFALPWHLHLLVRHGQPTMSNHTGWSPRVAIFMNFAQMGTATSDAKPRGRIVFAWSNPTHTPATSLGV